MSEINTDHVSFRPDDDNLVIELRLEPLGVARKDAPRFRTDEAKIVAARMRTRATAYKRDLRSLLGDPKTSLLDQLTIRRLAEDACRRYIADIGLTSERAVRILLEDGMSSVGVDMLTQKLSPEVVRALYYDSPVWQAYSGMAQDLVQRTNQVLMKHMVQTTDLNKYGKPKGIDKQAMIRDLVEVADIGERRARTIARTESRVIQNKGKEIGFKIRDPAGEWRYKWGGPYDPKNTGGRLRPACKEVIDRTPAEGYTLEGLKQALKDAVSKHSPGLIPRDFSGGPNCRHFPQKMITRFDPEAAE